MTTSGVIWSIWRAILVALTLLAILTLFGCAGNGRVSGIDLTIGQYEEGIWYDSDDELYHPDGWGFKTSIRWGKMLRPVGRIYLLDYWFGSDERREELNPWKNPWNRWFTIRLPWAVGVWHSAALGKVGWYGGLKTWRTDLDDLKTDFFWLDDDELANDDVPVKTYLCPSASIRRTRDK